MRVGFSTEWLEARNLRACAGCPNTFTPNYPEQRFCTQECAAAHTGRITMKTNRKMVPRVQVEEKVCPTCKTKFQSWKASERVFCSTRCAADNPELKRKRVETYKSRPQNTSYSRCSKGWVELGERRFYAKSKWEANYGRLLEWWRQRGHIQDWRYEAQTFWFEGIRRGVLSYLPDFKVTAKDGSVSYHEVKGWMDSKSKTKLKRMKKYHPHIVVVLRDTEWFRSNSRTLSALVPGWNK